MWDKKFDTFCEKMKQFELDCGFVIDEKIYQSFYQLNRSVLEDAEQEFSQLKTDKEKESFILHVRDSLGKYFFLSHMFKYSYEKPQGYPGDFRMMDFIYNDEPLSESAMGKYYDRFYLDNPYAEAVRCRKDKIVEILGRILKGSKSCRVLNIACGPSREVKELSVLEDLSQNFTMLAVDHDQDALDFSNEQMKKVQPVIDVEFLKADVFKYFRNPAIAREAIGLFDLVYSTGLADYLPDLLFVKMIKFFNFVTRPGGVFVLAHKVEDQDLFAPVTPRFICDWRFNKRTEMDLAVALQKAGIKKEAVEFEAWDRSHRIKFFVIKNIE